MSFSNTPLLPNVIELKKNNASSIAVLCEIPSNHPSTDGHFEDHPIVPGFIQFFWVQTFAQKELHVELTGNIKKLKFKRLLKPSTSFTIDITVTPKHYIAFTVSNEHGPFSSGNAEILISSNNG